jgi:hypothetical protein
MNPNRFAVVALAGALAAAGCASAATTGAASAATAASAAGTSAAGTSAAGTRGMTHIAVYSINSDGPRFRVIVTGPVIGDYGPAVTVFPDGRIDPDHTSQIRLELTRGSFRISIAALGKKLVSAFGGSAYYRSTCSGHVSVTAAASVVPGSGTGSYRGISGSFDLTATVDEIDKEPCGAPSGFITQIIDIAGSGIVSR